MVFAHDTEAALIGVAALVNNPLPDVAALEAYFEANRWSGRLDRTEAELRSMRDLRPRLRRLWEQDEDRLVDLLNGMLREFNALPQLVKHDGWPYHLHATPQDAPFATRMALEAAMAFVDVVRTGELSRLRICEFPDCGNVVVYLSKNRSKRFCDAGCGNRAAVTAYRARKAAARETL